MAFPSPASQTGTEAEENELYKYTFQGKWDKVVELYKTKPSLHCSEITSSKDTALHMAINDDRGDIVERLVGIIMESEMEEALEMKNDRGETPLHRAAARGSVGMCECIVKAGNDKDLDLLTITNKGGETPIFMAALHNRKHALLCLHHAAINYPPKKEDLDLRRRKDDGDTILHTAIRREHFDLAFHIIRLYPDLLDKFNAKGMTPLHVLASKPSAFKSGSHLPWWHKIVYYCIHVDPLKYDPTIRTTPDLRSSRKCPENYQTCYEFLASCNSALRRVSKSLRGSDKSSSSASTKSGQIPNRLLGKGKKEGGDPENPDNKLINENIPQNYATCFEFLAFVFVNFSGVIGFGKKFKDIKNAREKHTWSVQILDELMKKPAMAYIKDGSDPGELEGLEFPGFDLPERPFNGSINTQTQQGEGDKEKENRTDTALLVAAQKGVLEVVKKILDQLPVSIYETSSKNKNILLVAVENRQPNIFNALHKHLTEVVKKPNLWDDLIQAVDNDDNTILHLAAKPEESISHPWQIHGSAMQMQWEIKWYEYVKSFPPPHFVFLTNKKEETPGQIFTESHEKLVKDSGEWLKDTSESCSVVAALVAGVSFATSSSVPGGNDDKTGKPTLEGQPAFDVFAITALIGLCFSVTALVMFLSILTSRKQPKDFKKNLPLKLLLGLSSLFVSIASMLISFCAAHFFVLEDKFKKAVFPLYAATCLPVSFYAIAQFPLYMDLLKAIVTDVPQSRYYFGHL